ncbi:PTS mannitol transporter subunit IIA [Anoxybacterium hadale]|uniref:PTS mannitol transporter subunit IIA n=1 Tax=Anoxybacterium hadale TaxID=3408580 RepID=A0ACD1A914_9FIRM|nr:PTS mannitol transporter subunit IIA [Clostridiales bacterium]
MNKFILNEGNILLNVAAEGKYEAIERTGKLLAANGYVEPDYIEGMRKREDEVTTYIGNGISIPHGTSQYVNSIKTSGIVVLQYPEGVDFGEGNVAYILIGIAGKNDEHLEILSAIALVCQDEDNVSKLRHAATKEEIISILTEGDE